MSTRWRAKAAKLAAKAVVAGMVATAAGTGTATAADLHSPLGVAQEVAARKGVLSYLIKGAITGLQWLVRTFPKWGPWVEPILRLLVELQEILESGRRSDRTEKALGEALERLALLESELARSKEANAAEVQTLRSMLKKLSEQLQHERRRYKTCGEGQSRQPDGSCKDHRQ